MVRIVFDRHVQGIRVYMGASYGLALQLAGDMAMGVELRALIPHSRWGGGGSLVLIGSKCIHRDADEIVFSRAI